MIKRKITEPRNSLKQIKNKRNWSYDIRDTVILWNCEAHKMVTDIQIGHLFALVY